MNYQTLLRLRTMSDSELADIAFRMADKHPETFLQLITVDTKTDFVVPGTNQTVTFTAEQLRGFRAYKQDNKVTLIREIREATKLGLKEAKDLVETEFLK